MPPELCHRLAPPDPSHASATDSSALIHPPPPLITTASTCCSDLAALTFSLPLIFQEKCKSFCGLNVCDDDIAKKGALSIIKFVPKIKYLWLRRAKIGRQSLITLLQNCKDLELLYIRECCVFDEEDEEIAKLVASVPKFMCEGSRVGQ
ncbi:hypothetical protein ACLB2K_017428 [Fragaria x ananassa]